MVAPASCCASRSARQPNTWLRVTARKSPGWVIPQLAMKERMSLSYARRVCGLLMLANHWASAGTSANCSKAALVRLRGAAGVRAVVIIKNGWCRPKDRCTALSE